MIQTMFNFNTIFAIASCIELLFIIYLLIFRSKHFKGLVKDFKNALEDNAMISRSIIYNHFDTMNTRTENMLESLTQNSQIALKNLIDDTREETEKVLRSTILNVMKISDELGSLTTAQVVLNNRLSSLEETNQYLSNELKTRDAIIERKTRQIARLKRNKCDLK